MGNWKVWIIFAWYLVVIFMTYQCTALLQVCPIVTYRGAMTEVVFVYRFVVTGKVGIITKIPISLIFSITKVFYDESSFTSYVSDVINIAFFISRLWAAELTKTPGPIIKVYGMFTTGTLSTPTDGPQREGVVYLAKYW